MILRYSAFTSPLEGEVAARLCGRRVGGEVFGTAKTLPPHPARKASPTSPSRGEVRRKGLSLLEVLLALSILVLALAALGQLVDFGTERGNDARYYTRGTRLAQSKMAEVEAGLIPLTSDADGQFEGDDAAWTFKVTPEPAGPPNLFNVTVRVTRGSGRPLEVVLTQLIFDPAFMGSAAQAEKPPPPDDTTMPTTPMGGTTP